MAMMGSSLSASYIAGPPAIQQRTSRARLCPSAGRAFASAGDESSGSSASSASVRVSSKSLVVLAREKGGDESEMPPAHARVLVGTSKAEPASAVRCSDESALALQSSGSSSSGASESGAGASSKKQQQQQRARKRRLQQQRARKRRLQQQTPNATAGPAAAATASGDTCLSSAGDEQKNKGDASSKTTSQLKQQQDQQQQQRQRAGGGNKTRAASSVQQQRPALLEALARGSFDRLQQQQRQPANCYKFANRQQSPSSKQIIGSEPEFATATTILVDNSISKSAAAASRNNSNDNINSSETPESASKVKHTGSYERTAHATSDSSQTSDQQQQSDKSRQTLTASSSKQKSESDFTQDQLLIESIMFIGSKNNNNNNSSTNCCSTSSSRSSRNGKKCKSKYYSSSSSLTSTSSSSSSSASASKSASSQKHQQHRFKQMKPLENQPQTAAAAHWKQRTSLQLQQQQQLLMHRLDPQTTLVTNQQYSGGGGGNSTTRSHFNSFEDSSPHNKFTATPTCNIIDRLIIPATNLNLNSINNTKQQILFGADYVEQQLEANCCCCWERDPNNRDYCTGQLSHLPHCHAISKPPRRPWIETPLVVGAAEAAAGGRGQARRCGQQPHISYAKTDGHDAAEFTVLSYNVLCDRMAKPHYFPSAPYSALRWSYRRAKILDQLREYNADIVALQELEYDHFECFFKPKLAALHYEGIFEPKSRVRTMESLDMIRRVDGCAIFYKQNKFRLVERHLLEFRRIAVANANGNQPMINRVMTKDNIGLAAILELLPATSNMQQQQQQQQLQQQPLNRKSQKQRSQPRTMMIDEDKRQQQRHILVCNTHIHWDPDDCDVKLIQTIMLMDELGSIARRHATRDLMAQPSTLASRTITMTDSIASPPFLCCGDQEDNELMPLILLGDFNSMPNSGVTDYLINGEISSLHKDFKDYRYSAIGSGLNGLRRQSSPAWCNYTTANANNAPSSNSPPSTPTITKKIAATSSDDTSLLVRQATHPSDHFTLSPDSSAYPGPSPDCPDSTAILSSSPSTSTSSVDSACYSSSSSPTPVLNYSHPFKLTSAYEKNIVPFTNYTQKFQAIIDYIFYSNESLQLLGLLGPLDKNWLRANQIRTLPQLHVPSDHLPLLVKFRFSSAWLAPVEQPRLVSSMQYNGTLHVSRPIRPTAGQEDDNNCRNRADMPVGGDRSAYKLSQPIQHREQPKSRWNGQQHPRLARTTSQRVSNKFDKK